MSDCTIILSFPRLKSKNNRAMLTVIKQVDSLLRVAIIKISKIELFFINNDVSRQNKKNNVGISYA